MDIIIEKINYLSHNHSTGIFSNSFFKSENTKSLLNSYEAINDFMFIPVINSEFF